MLTASLNFAGGVFRLEGACQASESRRVKGICQRMLMKRTKIDQAAPLTVEQVTVLEHEVQHGPNMQQRVFA
eukprot:6028261-Amphidinium_carterae.1